MASDLERLRGLRILVVEDSFVLADELREVLMELGCTTVGPAARASEGWSLASAHMLDGALLDVNLSRGETSFPIATVLAARNVPFVFITGYDFDSSFPPEFREAPRMAKPLDPASLVRAMLRHFAPALSRH
jgi:CheY-like chemotaxis protein